MSIKDFPEKAALWYKGSEEHYCASFEKLKPQTKYSTHLPAHSKDASIYSVAQNTLLYPWRKSLQFLGRVVQPMPGENKGNIIKDLGVRGGSAVACVLLMPFAIFAVGAALPFYLYGHSKRPFISAMDTSNATAPISDFKGRLDFRTYNLGFTYESTSIVGDLRPPVERAKEIASHLLEEKDGPDVICFQEAFHHTAAQALCEEIKKRYPYTIHSVAPHPSGLSSGMLIVSKYPIEEVSFRRFDNLIGPEKLSTRGLLGIRVQLGKHSFANIYNTHLQALHGKQRAEVRQQQLDQIVKWMENDNKGDIERETDGRTKIGDFLMGDLNVSALNINGKRNELELKTLSFINKHFIDAFAYDHDAITGERLKGSPRFLNAENTKLIEPTASSYNGPQANKIVFLIKERLESFFYGVKHGEKVVEPNPQVAWGTPEWSKGPREANVVRYDYQLVKKSTAAPGFSVTSTEIEHIATKAQSGPSDHLPLRAIYSYTPNSV